MTLQHIFYIPAIFLMGLVFGTMLNKKLPGQDDQLQHRTSKKNLLQTFLIFLIVFAITHIFEIPWGSKVLSQQLGGVEIFDKSPLYSSKEVYERVSLFPHEGLNAYKRFTYTIDILFPLSFFLFLLTFARFVSQRKILQKYLALALVGLPVLWFAFDLIENVFIFIILSSYPGENTFLGSSLGFITAIKFGLLLLSIMTPSLLLITKNNAKVRTFQP